MAGSGAIRPTLLSRLVKGIVLWLYRRQRWTLSGTPPTSPKSVMLGVPHTTNWDFVFFLGAVTQLGITPGFMGKHSLFRWPMTRFMYDMGGISVDRTRKNQNYVEQVAQEFRRRDDLALVIAPEGTRGAITAWRTGFYHIARSAGVPIVPAWVDHARRRGGVGPEIFPSGDFEADFRRIAEFYRSVLPDHPRLKILFAQAGLIEAPAHG